MGNSGDNQGIELGAEIYVAAEHPSRLSGQYGHVVELDAELDLVLVELASGGCVWVRSSDVVPAYIVGEL